MLELLLSPAFRCGGHCPFTCSVVCRHANHETTVECLWAIGSRTIVVAIDFCVAKDQWWPIKRANQCNPSPFVTQEFVVEEDVKLSESWPSCRRCEHTRANTSEVSCKHAARVLAVGASLMRCARFRLISVRPQPRLAPGICIGLIGWIGSSN